MSNLLLTWTPSTDNVAVTGYDLLINGIINHVGNVTSYVVEDTSFSGYEFYVRAYDAAGNKSPWAGPYTATQRVVEDGEQVIEDDENILEAY